MESRASVNGPEMLVLAQKPTPQQLCEALHSQKRVYRNSWVLTLPCTAPALNNPYPPVEAEAPGPDVSTSASWALYCLGAGSERNRPETNGGAPLDCTLTSQLPHLCNHPDFITLLSQHSLV